MSGPREYVLSSEAVTSSTALVWDRATIRSLAAEIPRLLENALLVAYDYLVHYRIRHVAAELSVGSAAVGAGSGVSGEGDGAEGSGRSGAAGEE